MKRRRPYSFKSEAELCELFADVARAEGWVVYPETSGWDLLLVGLFGVQVGVEAKLKCNVPVLAQAIDGDHDAWPGPDFRGVLVPQATENFEAVAGALRLACWSGVDLEHDQDARTYLRGKGHEVDPVIAGKLLPSRRRRHVAPLWVPPYVPDVAAGVPAPVQLTKWKVSAIRVCAVLRQRGHVTSADFETHGISPQRWVGKWVEDSGHKDGRRKMEVV